MLCAAARPLWWSGELPRAPGKACFHPLRTREIREAELPQRHRTRPPGARRRRRQSTAWKTERRAHPTSAPLPKATPTSAPLPKATPTSAPFRGPRPRGPASRRPRPRGPASRRPRPRERQPPSLPREIRPGLGLQRAVVWRPVRGCLAGALCLGLECCFSGTPSLSFLFSRVDGEHHWLTNWSGYNTRWAKIILPRLIRKGNNLDNPVVVTIFFGANDSALKDENPKQHIPLEEYVANLKSMVQYLKSVDVPEHRVILITPPPLCETAWEKECIMQGWKINRLNSVVGEYASVCLQVAQDCGTDVLDLWTMMQKDNEETGESTGKEYL
ncbi:isoamyl acetate-hydrolyzing esterase 1 homolog isoform X3 [Ictidomys tridecemlineatus]